MNDLSSYITTQKSANCFTLVAGNMPAPLCAGSGEYPGVIRVLKYLQADIESVTNAKPQLFIAAIPAAKEFILAGTLGKNPVIDRLAAEKKIDVTGIAGKWECFLLQVVEKPLPGVERILVIAGSDKRGTLYGIFDLSAHIGISPWYWWADVPVIKKSALYVLPGRYTQGAPAVKYRGIFINDEAPALYDWACKKFGDLNHHFYERVFELLLRLKANYLWPAMWINAFNDDDPLNPQLADEYGIVMGTSHHEPMLRSQQEWKRYGTGEWDYTVNEDVLKAFWRQGIKNMGTHESIITLGMRGDGDMPMAEENNRELLEKIITDQRAILEEATGRPAASIPQVWVIYKEVQDYYEMGMQVPGDVTLMLCDDNWGNIRKLPAPGGAGRPGGYGLYYHYDYVGAPRNYKWLNTASLPRVWEQLHLAYSYGVDCIWIVNVGDIKPVEFPVEFFLDYAWNPGSWPAGRIAEYTRLWAEKQFGAEHAPAISRILSLYTQYNSRRKPELLSPDTYSLVHYREAETIVADYNRLVSEAEQTGKTLPAAWQDAYYQLVLYPVLACANLNALYAAAGKNLLYAAQGRAATNDLAEQVKALFEKDAALSRYYNHTLAGGKWCHMMDQTHIGYTDWQQPEKDEMPLVKQLTIPEAADMGAAVEDSESWWPAAGHEAELPGFYRYGRQHYFEVFNRGQIPFTCTIEPGAPWLCIDNKQIVVEKEKRIWVSIDWQAAPAGITRVPVTLTGPGGSSIILYALVNNVPYPGLEDAAGFIEADGYVSIESEHYARAIADAPYEWQLLPGAGRTLSGITLFPVTARDLSQAGDNPRLEYKLYTLGRGKARVYAYISPTIDFRSAGGLRYAIAFDDAEFQIVNIHADDSILTWEKVVGDNINLSVSRHHLDKPGWHTLKFRVLDPGIVLQKLVVATGKLHPSYLGPPESFYLG